MYTRIFFFSSKVLTLKNKNITVSPQIQKRKKKHFSAKRIHFCRGDCCSSMLQQATGNSAQEQAGASRSRQEQEQEHAATTGGNRPKNYRKTIQKQPTKEPSKVLSRSICDRTSLDTKIIKQSIEHRSKFVAKSSNISQIGSAEI